jgi:uracil-DNA glycosylase family 4
MDFQTEHGGPDDGQPGLRELLAFYAEAGVDAALVDEPIDRFAAEAREPVARNRQPPTEPSQGRAAPAMRQSPPPSSAPRTPIAVPDEGQVAAARQRASTAATLAELHEQMAAFDGCNLKFTAKNLVFADGNPSADLMLVGEAPGRDEDLEGLPFVGRSGQLLDRILAAIGLDRQSTYIANVIPWRPPGNRAPTPQETEICRPFIERQIELARPKVLVTLGGPSAKTLLNTTEGVMRLRGNWKVHVTASGVEIPAMPTLHPAYLLRNPSHKKFTWRDFLEVQAKLRTLA